MILFRCVRSGQLGTLGGAKSFLIGVQIFKTTSNSFKLYPTHFSRWANFFQQGFAPPDYRPGSGVSNTRAACGSGGRFVRPAMLFGNFLITMTLFIVHSTVFERVRLAREQVLDERTNG